MERRQVNLSKWKRRNLWVDSAGQTVVRPGLQEAYNASLVGGFSVVRDSDNQVFHYTFTSTQVSVRNSLWGATMSNFTWGTSAPEHVTYAIVGGQIIIASPGHPTLWGLVGGDLYEATPGTSLNPDLTEQPIPRGLVVAWANRVVYASGNELQFSDAGNPRSIISTNIVNPPGAAIVGLHVSGRGDLYVVTTTGVYTLPPEASYGRGETVFGVFSKVTDYAAPRVGCTATVRGRVWGVTRTGIRLIDTADPYEVALSEPYVAMTTGDRIAAEDFRPLARIYAGSDGPVVSVPSLSAVCMLDESSQTYSWWTSNMSDALAVRGTGADDMGRDLLFLEGGAYSIGGNSDEGDTTVYGVFLGQVPTPPSASMVLREVQVASDTGGNIVAAAAGTQKTAAPPQVGVIPGTTEDATGTWTTAPLRSRALDFANRTDDHALEVGAQNCLSRLPEMATVTFAAAGRMRESN